MLALSVFVVVTALSLFALPAASADTNPLAGYSPSPQPAVAVTNQATTTNTSVSSNVPGQSTVPSSPISAATPTFSIQGPPPSQYGSSERSVYLGNQKVEVDLGTTQVWYDPPREQVFGVKKNVPVNLGSQAVDVNIGQQYVWYDPDPEYVWVSTPQGGKYMMVDLPPTYGWVNIGQRSVQANLGSQTFSVPAEGGYVTVDPTPTYITASVDVGRANVLTNPTQVWDPQSGTYVTVGSHYANAYVGRVNYSGMVDPKPTQVWITPTPVYADPPGRYYTVSLGKRTVDVNLGSQTFTVPNEGGYVTVDPKPITVNQKVNAGTVTIYTDAYSTFDSGTGAYVTVPGKAVQVAVGEIQVNQTVDPKPVQVYVEPLQVPHSVNLGRETVNVYLGSRSVYIPSEYMDVQIDGGWQYNYQTGQWTYNQPRTERIWVDSSYQYVDLGTKSVEVDLGYQTIYAPVTGGYQWVYPNPTYVSTSVNVGSVNVNLASQRIYYYDWKTNSYVWATVPARTRSVYIGNIMVSTYVYPKPRYMWLPPVYAGSSTFLW